MSNTFRSIRFIRLQHFAAILQLLTLKYNTFIKQNNRLLLKTFVTIDTQLSTIQTYVTQLPNKSFVFILLYLNIIIICNLYPIFLFIN